MREEVGEHLEERAPLEDEGRQDDLGEIHPDAHLRQQVGDDAAMHVEGVH